MKAYRDRQHAGTVLANALRHYAKLSDGIVLALPRGGVPVAFPVAKALSWPLEVLLVRKLGVPGQEELAMGAVSRTGVVVFNEALIASWHISTATIQTVLQAEKIELARRDALYRGNKPFPSLRDKTILLIDDGMATGATLKAAVVTLRAQPIKKLIVAVPVASQEAYHELSAMVDAFICPCLPENFSAVGAWYDDFSPCLDETVCDLLHRMSME